jgi:MoaA/NifB/PqqE/SkfB family radical SAM enzyme
LINKLVLTGGEPFLRSDIFKICDYSHKKGLFNIVTTNGILISDSLAEEIVVSKINHLHFSIDGKEKSHDFFRGEGTFRKAVDAITRIRDRRTQRNIFSIGIACTVMDTNVHELFELLKLSEELGVESMSYQPVIANNADFSVGDISSYWPSEKKLPMLRSEIEQIRAYKPKRLKVCDEPRLELLLKYYNKELTRRDWICFGGFKTVFICYEKMDPLVYSCHGVCGNLRNISLKKAWESEEAHRLRIHSGSCKKLCLQGCYSYEKAQSLANLIFHN